jgi:1-acyl-sn-glycerol-3-phosphate acyltransferase
MAEAYRSGLPVLFFLKGTTTDGAYEDGDVMSFRRGLFHSVLNEGVPLRVAALGYSLVHENGEATVGQNICWWGDMFLGPHLFRFLALRGVRVEVRFGAEVVARADRFVLSETAREAVVELYEGLSRCESHAVRYEAELVEAL